MKNLTKQLLYKGDNVARANVVWNIAGSFVYAFASMVLSFLVIRMAGEEKGGIFSFGYSTLGQQLFLVAYFGIRPFHWFPFCNREEKLVHAYVWKPPDRNGNLADYRGKDQRSYFRDASFQPEDDR